MSTHLTKKLVDYGPGMKTSHCGICAFFQTPNSCLKVAGQIEASAWCKLFKKK